MPSSRTLPTSGERHNRGSNCWSSASALGSCSSIGGYYNIQMGHWCDGIQIKSAKLTLPGTGNRARPTSPAPCAKVRQFRVQRLSDFHRGRVRPYFFAVFVAACVGPLTGHFVWIAEAQHVAWDNGENHQQ